MSQQFSTNTYSGDSQDLKTYDSNLYDVSSFNDIYGQFDSYDTNGWDSNAGWDHTDTTATHKANRISLKNILLNNPDGTSGRKKGIWVRSSNHIDFENGGYSTYKDSSLTQRLYVALFTETEFENDSITSSWPNYLKTGDYNKWTGGSGGPDSISSFYNIFKVIDTDNSVWVLYFGITGNDLEWWPVDHTDSLYTYATPFWSTICIMEGHDIQTDDGIKKIENITINDKINNSQVIKIYKQPITQQLVKFTKDCFGNNIPNQDVYVTHNHIVFDKNTNTLQNAILFAIDKKWNTVYLSDAPKQHTYNILLKDWCIMNVNGLSCETLCPYNQIAINEFISQGIYDTSHSVYIQELIHIETVNDVFVKECKILPKKLKDIKYTNIHNDTQKLKFINELLIHT